jgi:hypothetical protein
MTSITSICVHTILGKEREEKQKRKDESKKGREG